MILRHLQKAGGYPCLLSHVEYPGVPVQAGHLHAGPGLVGSPAGVVRYPAVIGNGPCSSGRAL